MILEVKELKKYYPIEKGFFKTTGGVIRAVDGVSFSLDEKEALGIVGESGCGKTTLVKLLLRLIAADSGEIIFSSKLSHLRKDAAIVFQDPLLSLDPRMKIKDILLEPFQAAGLKDDSKSINRLLELVGLSNALLTRLPRQLSGGERQRACIARAIALSPKLLILDEPLSSLDLIMQKQTLDLLLKLKEKFGMAYIFISHNIAVVKKISSRMLVMFQGKIVEQGATDKVLTQPASGYTKKLLEAAR